MRRREQLALATRHRPPRSDSAQLQTKLDVARTALVEVTASAALVDAQAIADDALAVL
jgi:hypothetical protein